MKPVYIILIIVAIVIIYYNYRVQHFVNSFIDKGLYVLTGTIDLSYTNYYEEVLSENPKIVYIHNFINSKQAKHFIELGEKYKKPSTVDSKASPTTLKQDIRSSNSAHIEKNKDAIVTQLEKLATKYMNVDASHLEPFQVVVYEKGQKYSPHYDFFSPDSIEIINRGNRNKTILVYLNDVPEESGGATFFPKLNLKIQPKANDAIYFENMNGSELDYNTLHAGEPILNDIKKYAINIWAREKPIY